MSNWLCEKNQVVPVISNWICREIDASKDGVSLFNLETGASILFTKDKTVLWFSSSHAVVDLTASYGKSSKEILTALNLTKEVKLNILKFLEESTL